MGVYNNLGRSVAQRGNLGLISTNVMCNKDTDAHSIIVFFMVLLANFIHASACLLL